MSKEQIDSKSEDEKVAKYFRVFPNDWTEIKKVCDSYNEENRTTTAASKLIADVITRLCCTDDIHRSLFRDLCSGPNLKDVLSRISDFVAALEFANHTYHKKTFDYAIWSIA